MGPTGTVPSIPVNNTLISKKSKGVYRVLNNLPVNTYSLKFKHLFPVYQTCLKFTKQLQTISITGTSPVTSTELSVRIDVDRPTNSTNTKYIPVFYIHFKPKYRVVYFIFNPNKKKNEKSI